MDEEHQLFEFTYLNREDTRRKCEKALEIHMEVFGRPPDGGEAPPNWSYSSEALKTFLEYYPYVSTYKIVFPRRKPPLIARAYIVTYSVENPSKRIESFRRELEYYNPENLRMVLHPQDVRFGGLEETFHKALDLIEGRGYQLNTYRKIFA